jgi:hypothetical protein
MNHARAIELLIDFMDGRLDQVTQAEIDDHIATCGECRDWIETYELITMSFGGQAAGQHPNGDILALCAARADEQYEPDRESLRHHLERCPDCRSDLQLVHAAVLGARPASDHLPVPVEKRRVARWALAVAAAAATFAISSVLWFGAPNPMSEGTTPVRDGVGTVPVALETRSEDVFEFSEPEIDGTRVIDTSGSILVSRTRIREGADVTIRSGQVVAFGNGFQIGNQARIVVGGHSIDQPVEHRGVHGG